MQFCTTCGRRRAEGARFCTGCGQPFADAGTVAGGAAGPPEADRGAAGPPEADHWAAGPPEADHWAAGAPEADDPTAVLQDAPPSPPPSRRPLRLAIVALIVVALVGGGTASALVLTRHHPTSQAAGKPAPATPSTTSVTPSTAPVTPSTAPVTPSTVPATPPPSPAPSVPAAGNSGNGQVQVAASVAGNSQTPQVLGFLDSYFAAINGHSYHGYRALLNPAEADALTHAQFQNGYESTSDSAESLRGISTGVNGQTIAKVVFISHQNAANSVDGSQTCTRWHVRLYLQPNGTGYLLGKSPPGYHASYASC